MSLWEELSRMAVVRGFRVCDLLVCDFVILQFFERARYSLFQSLIQRCFPGHDRCSSPKVRNLPSFLDEKQKNREPITHFKKGHVLLVPPDYGSIQRIESVAENKRTPEVPLELRNRKQGHRPQIHDCDTSPGVCCFLIFETRISARGGHSPLEQWPGLPNLFYRG